MDEPALRLADDSPWLERAILMANRGVTTTAIIPASVGSQWWRRYVTGAGAEVTFLVGRVKFVDADGIHRKGTLHDCAIVVWRPPFYVPHWKA